MRALVFEAYLAGHRGQYAGLLATELVRLGVETKIAIPVNQRDIPEFEITLGHLRNKAEFVLLPELNYQRRNIVKAPELAALQTAVKRVRPDHVYVPFADVICRQMAFPWNRSCRKVAECPVEGLVMLTRGAYPANGLKERLRSRWVDHCIMSSAFERLHTLDALSYQYMKARTSNAVFLMPEAIPTTDHQSKTEARRILRLPTKQTIITCPGGVQERKGAHLLIEAVRRLKHTNVCLALIGRHSPYMKNFVAEQCAQLIADGRLITRNEFTTNEEFDLLFRAGDILAVPYPEHHGSASILIRAAKSGRKVITSDRGWPGRMATEHGLGVAVNVSNPDQFAAALGTMISTSTAKPTPRSQEFLRFHSLENYLAHWTELIGRKHNILTRKPVPFLEAREQTTAPASESARHAA